MKTMRNIILITALALTAGGCSSSRRGEDTHAAAEAAGGHDHGSAIELCGSQAARLGVKTDTLRRMSLRPALRAAATVERAAADDGRAVAPLNGRVRLAAGIAAGSTVKRGQTIATISTDGVSGGDSNAAARAALSAARAEVERLTPLYRERLATAAEYNAALAELARAEAMYTPGAGNSVTAPMGGTVTAIETPDGAYVQAGATIAVIASDDRLTLRADVPADSYGILQRVTDARIVTSDGRSRLISSMGGKRGGVSADGGYASVYFTFSNPGDIAPGQAVEAYLTGAGGREVLAVPLPALTEQQGSYFVYERHGKEHYLKHAVTTGETDGEYIEITSGLKGGEEIVTEGATIIRLAESSGAIPEGHSHSH